MHELTALTIESEIRRGIAEGAFDLAFQPQVSMTTGRMTGAEALARWHAPDGLRMPADFIPIAEQSGLIVPLGAFVLQTAFRRAAVLEELAPPGFLTWVNVSPNQILESDVVGLVEHSLSDSGASPAAVGIEITETSLLVDGPRTRSVLRDLRALGIQIALDDFGTGYSSLLYLRGFDLDVLKLGREFVQDLPWNNTDHVIVEAVVEVARALGMVTVAEGIETVAQLDAVRRLGCDVGQGFLLGYPMPAAALRGRLVDDVSTAGADRALEPVPA